MTWNIRLTEWMAKHRILLGCGLLAFAWIGAYTDGRFQGLLVGFVLIATIFIIVLHLSNLRTDQPVPKPQTLADRVLAAAAFISFVAAAYLHFVFDEYFQFIGIIMAMSAILNLPYRAPVDPNQVPVQQ